MTVRKISVLSGKETAGSYTASEVAEHAAAAAAAPMKRWEYDMEKMDQPLRVIDDLLAHILTGAPIPQKVIDRYNAKETRREQKP